MKTKTRILLAALLLALALPVLAAQDRVPVRHLMGDEPPETISAGWQTERAIYLLRLADDSLARHHARQSGPRIAGGEQRPAPLSLRSERSQDWLSHLDQQRGDFLERAAQRLGRPLEPVYIYRLANNGFAAEMTPAEAERLAHLPGVTAIHRDHEVELATDAGPHWIGAPSIWEATAIPGMDAFAGEGVVFAIIDTGIDHANPSFADDGHSNPLGSGNFLGDCAAGEAYAGRCNNKLIGLRGYGSVNDGDPEDIDGHGSHVAGTAAGNPLALTSNGETLDITGVAPRGNIIAYNACCTLSALSSAIDDIVGDYAELQAASPGVRMVTNYSIGASAQLSPWERFDGLGFLDARSAGIFVAVAAGNTGPQEATVWSPGVAPWVATVANSSHDRQLLDALVSISAPEPVPEALQDIEARSGGGPEVGELSNEVIRYAGHADPGNELGCEPFPADAFSNTVALILRGECNFSDKINHADDAGAHTVIMVNNEPGPPIPMGMADPVEIPAVMISQADGDAVIDWLAEHDDPRVGIEAGGISRDADLADRLNPSSSRGPAQTSPGVLLPDLTAPGTDILAAVASTGDPSWGFLTGTSMASPHVAGAAGLLMGVHPDWTEQEIQSALMLGAIHEITEWDNETPSNPYGVGAGRVDLERAANVGFVLDESAQAFMAANPDADGDPSTLNLPSLSTFACGNSCTLSRTLRGTEIGGSYTVSFETPDDLGLSVNQANFTIAENQEVTIDFTFSNIFEAEGRFGHVVFTPADPDAPTLRMPFVLSNLFATMEGSINGLVEGAFATLTLFREDEAGDPVVDQTLEFFGSGNALPYYLAVQPGEHYPAIVVESDGYLPAVLDNDGEGWTPEPGEQILNLDFNLELPPMVVSAVAVDGVERTAARAGFDVTSHGWAYAYTAVLIRNDEEVELESGLVGAPDTPDRLYIEMEGLPCSSDLRVDVRVERLIDPSDTATASLNVTTRSCFGGGDGGGIGCTAGDGNSRMDPVLPLLLMLAAFGFFGRRRKIVMSAEY